MPKLADKWQTVLPDLPSELILLALKDLKQVERLKRYEVRMVVYHEPRVHTEEGEELPKNKQTCRVCFAGAVMARTLKADPFKDLGPDAFDRDTYRKLRALDYLRNGAIENAFGILKIKVPKLIKGNESVYINTYHNSPERFKTDMLQLAKALQEIGY